MDILATVPTNALNLAGSIRLAKFSQLLPVLDAMAGNLNLKQGQRLQAQVTQILPNKAELKVGSASVMVATNTNANETGVEGPKALPGANLLSNPKMMVGQTVDLVVVSLYPKPTLGLLKSPEGMLSTNTAEATANSVLSLAVEGDMVSESSASMLPSAGQALRVDKMDKAALLSSPHAAAQPTSSVQLTAAAKIAASLGLSSMLPAKIQGSGQPLLMSSVANCKTVDTLQWAQALKGALSESGLFYESHQAEWVQGLRTLTSLWREPQARMSTVLTPENAASLESTITEAIPTLPSNTSQGESLGLQSPVDQASQNPMLVVDSAVAPGAPVDVDALPGPVLLTKVPDEVDLHLADLESMTSDIPIASVQAPESLLPATGVPPGASNLATILSVAKSLDQGEASVAESGNRTDGQHAPPIVDLAVSPFAEQAKILAEPIVHVSNERSSLDLELASMDSSVGSSANSMVANTPEVSSQVLSYVLQQLQALQTRQVAWEGWLWPQTWMEWHLQEGGEDSDGSAAPEGTKAMHWSTDLKLHLPHLGQVAASLQLSSQGMTVNLSAASVETTELLQRHYATLMERFAERGVTVWSGHVEQA